MDSGAVQELAALTVVAGSAVLAAEIGHSGIVNGKDEGQNVAPVGPSEGDKVDNVEGTAGNAPSRKVNEGSDGSQDGVGEPQGSAREGVNGASSMSLEEHNGGPKAMLQGDHVEIFPEVGSAEKLSMEGGVVSNAPPNVKTEADLPPETNAETNVQGSAGEKDEVMEGETAAIDKKEGGKVKEKEGESDNEENEEEESEEGESDEEAEAETDSSSEPSSSDEEEEEEENNKVTGDDVGMKASRELQEEDLEELMEGKKGVPEPEEVRSFIRIMWSNAAASFLRQISMLAAGGCS